MRKLLLITLFMVMFLISAAFAAFNMEPVSVKFYFTDLSLPLAVLLVLTLLIGMLAGAVVMWARSLKIRFDNHRLKHKLSLSEQELNSLRILPIKEPR